MRLLSRVPSAALLPGGGAAALLSAGRLSGASRVAWGQGLTSESYPQDIQALAARFHTQVDPGKGDTPTWPCK